MREKYYVQPYRVGARDRGSFALIIPAKVAREYNVTAESLFQVQGDTRNRTIQLQMVRIPSDVEKSVPPASAAGAQ